MKLPEVRIFGQNAGLKELQKELSYVEVGPATQATDTPRATSSGLTTDPSTGRLVPFKGQPYEVLGRDSSNLLHAINRETGARIQQRYIGMGDTKWEKTDNLVVTGLPGGTVVKERVTNMGQVRRVSVSSSRPHTPRVKAAIIDLHDGQLVLASQGPTIHDVGGKFKAMIRPYSNEARRGRQQAIAAQNTERATPPPTTEGTIHSPEFKNNPDRISPVAISHKSKWSF